MSIPYHPLANIFPMMQPHERAELVADMRESGFRQGEQIVLLEGQILDGRNRYEAAIEADIFPADVEPVTRWEFIQFSDDGMDGLFTPEEIEKGPLAYVLSKNLHRRHLDDRQRASVAGKIANLPRGRPAKGDGEIPPIGGFSAEQAATSLNVAPRQAERARVVHEKGVPELRDALDRGDVAVSVAEEIARKPEEEQREEVAARGLLPNGARAIMGSRQEPDDSLDYFPTPPWATRALMERVFPHLGRKRLAGGICEPACGEGHIAEVLKEYCQHVYASDVFDYGYADETADFLADDYIAGADWIITNPPFGDKAVAFVQKARHLARVGVAMFFRSQWAVEGVDRYERLFSYAPPTLCAFFVERVNLCKGRWEPDGSTATAYCWLVWISGDLPRPPLWIPPGCREQLTRPDDAERFTAHPVIKKLRPLGGAGNDADAVVVEHVTADDDEVEDIPAFLRRGDPGCTYGREP